MLDRNFYIVLFVLEIVFECVIGIFLIFLLITLYVNYISATTSKKRTSKLNFDDEEILILEVQNRPALWNYTLPLKERSAKMKKQLWEEIAQILNGKNKLIEFFLKSADFKNNFNK